MRRASRSLSKCNSIYADKESSIKNLAVIDELIECESRRLDGKFFIPIHALPDSYSTGWFETALQLQLESVDEAQCDEAISMYEDIDWLELRGQTQALSDSLDSFLNYVFRIVPWLCKCKAEWIERLLRVARAAFLSDPMRFIGRYRCLVDRFLPTSSLVEKGYLDYSSSPVSLFYLCYTLRVLKDRLPFSSVPVAIRMVKLVETALYSCSLENHLNNFNGDISTVREVEKVLERLIQD